MEQPPMEAALSTDVVMDIVLSHLRVEDLLSCRKVSKFWNTAVSSVLRKRSTMIKDISDETDLMELQECIKQNPDFPFSGLTFDKPWRLISAKATEFFKNYGARFTSLHLDVCLHTKLRDLAPLLNNLPRLSILEMSPSNGGSPPTGLLDSCAGMEDCRILNLPSVRTFRTYFDLDDDLLREVFAATSTSLRIEFLWCSYRRLKKLKGAGKLQAVSVLNVCANGDEEDYALRVDELFSTELPALTRLYFDAGAWITRKGLIKLLISSQHTLKELHLVGICPSEFSSECPVLAKLTTLSVSNEKSCKYCFQGSHGHKFPALTELKLCAYCEYPISDGLFIVPTVTRIDFEGLIGTNQMKKLAQTFPNVDTIGLKYYCYSVSAEINKTRGSCPSQIWNVGEFKQLEKLRIWDFVVTQPTKNYLNMDSFLTGIPLSICKNLQQQGPELMRNLIKSPFGEKFSEVIRENPSILQLKNLKELVICVQLEDGLEELPEEPPFMSMVSVLYALEMMPNLEAKFVYDYTWLSRNFEAEDRDAAVEMLKAAFELVHPHVELEPFFY